MDVSECEDYLTELVNILAAPVQQWDLPEVCQAALWGASNLQKELSGMHVQFHTHSQRHTAADMLMPMLREQELLKWLNMIFFFFFFTHFRLFAKTPLCEAMHAKAACHPSARGCFLQQRIWGISAMQRLLLPFLAAPV